MLPALGLSAVSVHRKDIQKLRTGKSLCKGVRDENNPNRTSHQAIFRGDDDPATVESELFDRKAQIAFYAKLLEWLRTEARDTWWQLNEKVRGAKDGSSERKFIVSKLIRWSSESADFARTVDFVTKRTYRILKQQANPNGHIKLGVVTSLKGFSHEHMVPCEAIFQIITTKSGSPSVHFY